VEETDLPVPTKESESIVVRLEVEVTGDKGAEGNEQSDNEEFAELFETNNY
jgi:hypothetical protein